MPSLRSTLLNFTTRQMMRFIFRRERPVTAYRAVFARLDPKRPMPAGITIEDIDLPRTGRWLRNSASTSPQAILYLHGGAFSMRLLNGHSAMVGDFCARSGASAFMPFYRLAPEHPFPAAPDDCLAAYRYLLDSGHHAKDIVVMGDSAGASLSLVLLHLIKREGLPMPSGVIALSPITDAAQISATWRQNRHLDPMYVVQAHVNPARWYFAGQHPMNPVISPYYGDLSGFPPFYLMVGGVEALLDDSIGMVRKAVESGIPAKVQVWRGMPHVFPLIDFLPEAKLARVEITQWLAALRNSPAQSSREDLWKSSVEWCDLKAITHRLLRETNEVYFRF